MPQRGASPARQSGIAPRRSRNDDDERNEASDGYDADKGPLDTGYAGKTASVVSEAEAELLGEAGLSLPPEELGTRLLREALQENNGGAPMDPDATREDDMDALEPTTDSVRLDDDSPDEDAISPAEPSDIDLTSNVVDEGSLFDQPRNEGGVRHPSLRTNEVDATLDRNERAARWGKKPKGDPR
jgi:hypothetical protein